MTPEHAALVAALEHVRDQLSTIANGGGNMEAIRRWAETERFAIDLALAASALPGATPLDERLRAAEEVRTLHEVREYLAILCGMRHWKRLDPADARAMAQAAQVIANEFAEHFSVALAPRGEEAGSD